MAKLTFPIDSIKEENNSILHFPVLDLNGNLIAQEGVQFSKQFLWKITQVAPQPKPFIPIEGLPTLWLDLNKAISDLPYRDLFLHTKIKTQLEDLLKIAQLSPFIIDGLNFFKEKDPYTYWHSLHVFVLTGYMAMELIRLPDWVRHFAVMGPLHDIGKINVPMEILQKKTPLTRKELQRLRHHTVAGAILLTYFHGEKDLLGSTVALDHHERLDGSGYPFGVPISNPIVEMVAICDVYDALISPRPYRNRPFDLRTGLELLTQLAVKGKFSTDTLRFMISIHRKGKPDYKEVTFSLEARGTPPEENVCGLFDE
ncbi:MAG: HD domain-containing phosphohydrolase [Thermodesulfobacteriota bacterium]|jgi:HD-GYP domain-containing protein (c-di-GMP phosphodiesterase class II)